MNRIQTSKIKSLGDIPNARFGHTFTMVSKSKAVLFGGAISQGGKFIITNETYVHDFISNRWKKLSFQASTMPSERAAHASAMISQGQLAVYGGAASGTQGLLKDDLYILDLRKEPVWRTIEMNNKANTPGQRYGHTMIYSKPYLVIFGGNTGSKAQNDVWLFNTQKAPFTWQRYDFENKPAPCPRVYHSAALCEEGSALGMMVVFGGRKQTKRQNSSSNKQMNTAALNDIWGLRKHRNGSWDWIFPPKNQHYNPLPRYQHLICFSGTMMIVVGGRTNMPQQATSLVEVYNTETSEWYQLEGVSRYRHAIVTIDNNLFMHGGFEPEFASQPLESMISLDLTILNKIRKPKPQILAENQNKFNEQITEKNIGNSRQVGNSRKDLREIKQSQRNLSNNSRIKLNQKPRQRDLTPSRMLASTKSIRLSNQVVIATGENNNIQIQKVPVNSLQEESKRLTEATKPSQLPCVQQQVIESFLNALLPMNGLSKSLHTTLFAFKKQKIIKLCEELTANLSELASSLIYVRAPVKIFGSLYGRYYELLRLFQNFGIPDEHEMETFDYVFLGNYVDKGYNSLETICLLFSLKLKYPEHIILLRGSHEDAKVNRLFGLAEECAVRLNENIADPNSVYNQINKVFEMLPLGVVVEDKILCVHSGVGNLNTLLEIEEIQRPGVVQKDKKLVDLLWSNTNQAKDIMGYNPSKMSESTLDKFLDDNGLSMLIRSKEYLQEGYVCEGNKLNLFSVSNYGKSGNNAAILKITKNLQFVPCILQPSNNLRGGWINDNMLKTGIVYTEEDQQLRKRMFSVKKK